jgi:hypothetical protein
MALVLQTFVSGQVLTAAQLNANFDLIEAKFSGAIQSTELAWPLTAQDDLDMAGYELENMDTLWEVRNLAERPAGVTIQDVFDEVEAAGGGIVYLPGNTTQTISSTVEVGSNTVVMGAGWSSVFNTGGTPGTLIMFKNKASADNIVFCDFKVDVSGAASGDVTGIQLDRVDRARIRDIWFSAVRGSGAAIDLASGSDGTGSTDVIIEDNFFDQSVSTTADVLIDNCKRVTIRRNFFNQPTAATAVSLLPDSSSSVIQDVVIDDNDVLCKLNATATNVFVVGNGTAVSATLRRSVEIINNRIDGNGDDASPHIKVDTWNYFKINHNTIHNGATSGLMYPAIAVDDSTDFAVNYNHIFNFEGDGISIGSLTGNGVALGSRTVGTADRFMVIGNMMEDIGLAGMIINASTRFNISNNTICDVSQELTVTYSGFEFWNCSNATTFRGAIFGHNSSFDATAGAPEQLGGLQVWDGSGAGSGETSAIGTDVGSGDIILIGNFMPGASIGAGGTDFVDNGAGMATISITACPTWVP